MPRKKRLKCGRIPARLFLACHQKSNTFKCKQFCCAKPMCAYLSVGCPLYPRQRRAAAPSSRLSVGSSAHSHANAPELERVCNITEAPPVADEARRCWRKTRSITPAPRAIGDYVLRGLCGGLQSKPSPRSSQTASTTAAQLLEACSSGVIKSLTLLFCVFSQVSQARPRVRLRKSGSGLEAPSAAAGHFLFDVNLVVHQPACSEEQTD